MKRQRPSSLREEISAPPHWQWLIALGFFIVTALAYAPAWSGQPIWDDDGHLTTPELQSLHGLARIWIEPGATQQYYPLVHTAFWLGHRAWGDALPPFHLLNIFLHALSAFLLFRLLTRLKIPGALLAAGIFALHPVQVESVAWISELKNTLSGFFYLSAALAYLRYDENRQRSHYLLALALFIAGLLSKSVIATLPAALLVIFWWQRGRISFARDLRPLLPFFVLGILAGAFTAWIEHHFIGASGAAYELPLITRGLLAGRVFWFYLSKLFWPSNLTFIYSRWEMSAAVWWQYLFPAALLVLLAALWKIRAQTRAPLAAVLFFLGTLFPALGFINVFPFLYSFVADHFQYLACIGLIVLAAAGFTRLLVRLKFPPYPFAIAVCAFLAFLTWRQAHLYADAETLYRTTLERNPDCWMAQNNLANLFVRQRKIPQALPHYRAALQLRPDYVEAHYNLGNALLETGDIDQSILQCEAAIALDPKSAEAHNNLANALLRRRRYAEARAHYEEAFRLVPRSLTYQINLASFLATSGDLSLRDGPRAFQLATTAVRLTNGSNLIALFTLGAACAEMSDWAQAFAITEKTLRLAEERGDMAMIQITQKQLALLRARGNETEP